MRGDQCQKYANRGVVSHNYWDVTFSNRGYILQEGVLIFERVRFERGSTHLEEGVHIRRGGTMNLIAAFEAV